MKLLQPLVQKMRRGMGYTELFVHRLLTMPPARAGTVSGRSDFAKSRREVIRLLKRMGIMRSEERKAWQGSRKVDHLGVRLNTDAKKSM